MTTTEPEKFSQLIGESEMFFATLIVRRFLDYRFKDENLKFFEQIFSIRVQLADR